MCIRLGWGIGEYKDTGDLHFPRKTSKVVGFHGDATELLGFHLSNYTSNSYPWPPL